MLGPLKCYTGFPVVVILMCTVGPVLIVLSATAVEPKFQGGDGVDPVLLIVCADSGPGNLSNVLKVMIFGQIAYTVWHTLI